MNIGKSIKRLFGGDKIKDRVKGITADTMGQYESAKQYWEDFLERGAESIRYYGGDQWDETSLGKYQSANRPKVTINMVAALVRQVTGMRTNERLQPRVIPEREGTVDMAWVYSHLIYFILKKNNYQAINYKVQEDQVVTGRGFWDVDVSFDDRPEGELVMHHLRWNQVLPDPLSEHPYYDDARYIFYGKLMTRDAIVKTYGEVEGSLMTSDDPNAMNWVDSDDLRDRNIHDDYVDASGMYLVVKKLTLVKKKKWMATDGERWHESDDKMNREDLDLLEMKQISKTNKILMEEIFVPAASGELPIYKGPCRLQTGHYNIVPCVCYNAGSKILGAVQDMKGEQDRMNKSFAQIIEILGYSSKGFWMIPRASGISEEQWKLNTSRPGGMVLYDGESKPEHVNPASMPQGYAEIFKQSLPNLQNITGITPARMGVSEYSGESGVKFAQKLQQAREQLAIIDKRFIDGFNRVVKLMMIAIPKVYTEEFAFQVMEGRDNVKDIKINEQTISGIFNDVVSDPGEYDVSVEQSEETSSIRQSHNLELATMMSQVGPQFAAFFASEWIRGSDMPDKEEKAQKLELLSGQLMQMEAMKLQLNAMQQQMKGATSDRKSGVEEANAKREDQRLELEAKKVTLDGMKAANEMKNQNSITDMENLERAVNVTRSPENGAN